MKNNFKDTSATAFIPVPEKYTSAMSSVRSDGREYEDGQTLLFVTDGRNIILGISGNPFVLTVHGYGVCFKANSAKTDFIMSAGGPTYFNIEGKLSPIQAPTLPNVDPNSPEGLEYARSVANQILAIDGYNRIDRRPAPDSLTADQRIHDIHNKILQNTQDIFNIKGMLSNLEKLISKSGIILKK